MKRPAINMVPCTHCDGLGKRPGNTTGAIMRLERESRGVTRLAVSPHFLKPDGATYSETYIIDLERDSRAWTVAMVESYRKAIEKAVEVRLRREQREQELEVV